MDLSSFAGAIVNFLRPRDGDGERSLFDVSMARLSGTRTVREALAEFRAELDRARRYENPLALAVMSVDPTDGRGSEGPWGSNGDRSILETKVPQLVSILVTALIEDGFRESDVVSYSPAEDRYVVLLTESDGRDARQAVRRLESLVAERAMVGLRAGVAEFPEDGLTLEDLLRAAEAEWLDGRRSRNGNGRPPSLATRDGRGVDAPAFEEDS